MDSQEAFDIAMAYLTVHLGLPDGLKNETALRELSAAKRKQLA